MSDTTANKIADALKSKNPTITSANIASPAINTQAKVPDELVVDDDEPIVAKPLVDPDFTKLKPRNKNLVLFWGNRVANNGLRIEDLKARGFKPAMATDFDDPPNALIKDGHIIRGDLMAMLIPRRDYLGQQLYNSQQADRRVSKARVKQDGEKNLQDDLREVGGLPAKYRGKVQMFTP